jgi:hypothetical protein
MSKQSHRSKKATNPRLEKRKRALMIGLVLSLCAAASVWARWMTPHIVISPIVAEPTPAAIISSRTDPAKEYIYAGGRLIATEEPTPRPTCCTGKQKPDCWCADSGGSAPTVNLALPSNNETFVAGSSIFLRAFANDSDGTVTKVEFFAGSNKLGEATTAPYDLMWRNVAAGSYSLTARATNGSNNTSDSSPVSITVVMATPNSLALNGTLDYLEVPNSPTINLTSAFTAEAWVRLNSSTGTYQSIFERYGQPDANGNNGGFYFRVKPDGKLEFGALRSIQAGIGVQGNTLLTNGVWHHVAGVCDGSQLRIYVDGQLDAALSYNYLPTTGMTNLFVGSGNWGGGRINGLIDEARLTASALYGADFTPQSQLLSEPSTRGLWKFDDASAGDFSGNGNNGLVRGTPNFSATLPALTNHSVSFNGTNGRVNVPISQSLNINGPLTVETWFKVNDNSSCQFLVGTQNGAGGFMLLANQGMPQLYITNNSGVNDFLIAWPPIITTGEWHHMAGVFDGNQYRLYLDGVLCASKNSTLAPGGVTTPLAIGSSFDGSWGWTNGLVDEVRVSASALYTSSFTPKRHLLSAATTRGLWKFDGQTLQDASGNGNNGIFSTDGANFSTSVP